MACGVLSHTGMLEAQKERAIRTSWLMAHGVSNDEARRMAEAGLAVFRPAFVGGRRREADSEDARFPVETRLQRRAGTISG